VEFDRAAAAARARAMGGPIEERFLEILGEA
jgi:hypothetical protein